MAQILSSEYSNADIPVLRQYVPVTAKPVIEGHVVPLVAIRPWKLNLIGALGRPRLLFVAEDAVVNVFSLDADIVKPLRTIDLQGADINQLRCDVLGGVPVVITVDDAGEV
eukprot:TRINITY_DN4414_c0_g2_i3.p1 TRINITY_DN4414_c0_g2~~TRINITY_DN4414_c0_g2_i3.p1  ORF type:complete len:111 (-),score=26.02 TRINITY_DN4414_c0_g2_i3:180-512(-)